MNPHLYVVVNFGVLVLELSFFNIYMTKWRSCVICGAHLDFSGFHRWQSNIGKEFSRCGGSQVQAGTVEESVLFANDIGIVAFEPFVQAKFEQTLGWITEQCWCPTFGQTTGSILLECDFETSDQILVFSLIDLQTAFDQIQWCQKSVRWTWQSKRIWKLYCHDQEFLLFYFHSISVN